MWFALDLVTQVVVSVNCDILWYEVIIIYLLNLAENCKYINAYKTKAFNKFSFAHNVLKLATHR